MFTRSILIPSLAVCALTAPFLFSESNVHHPPTTQTAPSGTFTSSWGQTTPQQTIPAQQPHTVANPAVLTNPATPPVPFGLVSHHNAASPTNAPHNSPQPTSLPVFPNGQTTPWLPDMAAAQTLVYPGNEFGPDLTAQPLTYLPVTNFQEIFRFDITQNWVTTRWSRVSTVAGEPGLHGLRVALVTGTNSWDLHGSLTYYFDQRQRVQRIAFRGWTGDASRLLQLLTGQYQFQAQSTNLAGFYQAKSWSKTTGGILLKHPPVISADHPLQKLAMVLEINNPASSFELSNEFQLLIAGSQSAQ